MNYSQKLRDLRAELINKLNGITHDFTLDLDSGDTQPIRLEYINLDSKEDELLQITYTHKSSGNNHDAYVIDLCDNCLYVVDVEDFISVDSTSMIEFNQVELESLAQIVDKIN